MTSRYPHNDAAWSGEGDGIDEGDASVDRPGTVTGLVAGRQGRIVPSWSFHFGPVLTDWGIVDLVEGLMNPGASAQRGIDVRVDIEEGWRRPLVRGRGRVPTVATPRGGRSCPAELRSAPGRRHGHIRQSCTCSVRSHGSVVAEVPTRST